MNWFRQIPFLRILIPFISGILLAFLLEESFRINEFNFFLTSLLLLSVYFIARSYSLKFWLIAADLFLLLFGFSLVQLQDPLLDKRHYTRMLKQDLPIQMIGRCEDVPSEKKKSIKILLSLLEMRQEGQSFNVNGKVLVYIRKHDQSGNLKAGQLIYLEGRLSEVEQKGNPGEFNYKQYLRNKQIVHMLFADSTSYCILPSQQGFSFTSLALRCKQYIVNRLDHSGLTSEAKGICSALLTGFDEEIGEDIVQSFSHSGTLHVLSVSGLHAGLIYAFLNVIFNLVDRYRRYRLLRFSLIVSGMWAFAFVCGLEAPILRAVVMLTFIGIGDLLYNSGRNSRLNILFLAAFILLCSNPFLLKDIGFQLSFSAILGLICVEPLLRDRLENKNTLRRWLLQGTAASFAATLFTLPFTLYYFKQFPYWFFLANLVVVPSAFALMILSIGALLHLQWVVLIINLFTKILLSFIHLFDSDSFAYAKGLNFRLEDALWMTLFLAFLLPAIQKRSYRWLVLSLFACFFWQFRSTVQAFKDMFDRQICIYNLKDASAVSVKDGNQLYYRCSKPDAFKKVLEAHLSVLGQPKTQPTEFNCMIWKNTRILIFDKTDSIPAYQGQMASIWVLTDDYPLNDQLFQNFDRPVQVVADGSNSYSQNQKNEQLCRKFAVSYYSLWKKGARAITKNEIENW